MAGMAKHNAGSRVEWTSQAGGHTATKSGKVIDVVPGFGHGSVADVANGHGIDLRAMKSRDRTGSTVSGYERYLVKVTAINGEKLKQPAYYAPIVAVVDRQAAERKQAKSVSRGAKKGLSNLGLTLKKGKFAAKKATSGQGIAKAVAKGVKKAFGSKVSATSKQGKVTVTAKKPVAKKAVAKGKAAA